MRGARTKNALRRSLSGGLVRLKLELFEVFTQSQYFGAGLVREAFYAVKSNIHLFKLMLDCRYTAFNPIKALINHIESASHLIS